MKYIFILFFLVSFTGCHETDKDDRVPGAICTEDPLENIQWLKDLINNTDTNGLEIIQYEYKQQTVFSVNNCLNCADNLITVYNCEGNTVCEFGGIAGLNTCSDFDTEAKSETVIFTDRHCEKGTIISAEQYKTLEASTIESAEIQQNCLSLTFTILSTQDKIEDVTLVDSGQILESFPIQRLLKFNIKENFTKPTSILVTTSFDISNLVEKGETVILNIDGFNETIEYTRVD